MLDPGPALPLSHSRLFPSTYLPRVLSSLSLRLVLTIMEASEQNGDSQKPSTAEVNHVEELKQLLAQAKHPQTIALLKRGLKEAESSVSNGLLPTVLKSRPIAKSTSSVPTVKISSYGWDQSERFVKIYITDISGVDGLSSDNIRTNFSEKSMEVELCGVGGKNYNLIINDLLMPINTDKSSAKVHGGNVVISLRKLSPKNWDCLTGREKKIKDMKEVKPSKPEPGEDPGAGLMQLMKKMYDDGDDEMKRTIKKAWFESQEKKNKGEL